MSIIIRPIFCCANATQRIQEWILEINLSMKRPICTRALYTKSLRCLFLSSPLAFKIACNHKQRILLVIFVVLDSQVPFTPVQSLKKPKLDLKVKYGQSVKVLLKLNFGNQQRVQIMHSHTWLSFIRHQYEPFTRVNRFHLSLQLRVIRLSLLDKYFSVQLLINHRTKPQHWVISSESWLRRNSDFFFI